MHNAVDIIPSQNDIEWGASWSCGPTSAAKAIHMFGGYMSKDRYIEFLASAPNANKIASNIGKGAFWTGGAVFAGSILLAPFTGGASLGVGVAGWGVGAAGVTTAIAAEALPDGGVGMRNLAKHTTRHLSGTKRAIYHDYNDWDECVAAIRYDIQRGDPVIVVHTYSPTEGHYINVVGVRVDKNNSPTAFMLMDTDNRLREISSTNMRYLMERRYFATKLFGLSFKNYHMIRFDS